MNQISLICMLILLALSSQVHAVPECFEPSEAFKAEGDNYFSSEPTLDEASISRLGAFLENVSGRWQGDTVSLTCIGNATHFKEKFVTGTVTARISRGESDELMVSAMIDYNDNAGETELTIRTMPSQDMAELIEVSNGIVLKDRSRQLNDEADSGEDSLIENTYDIRWKDGNLTLVRTTYVDGYLSTARILGMRKEAAASASEDTGAE